MKILHYISDFSLPSETFIYDLIRNLEGSEVENYILTHKRQLEKERPFLNVKVISEKVPFVKKVYFKLFDNWSIRNSKEILAYINDLRPDIIHAHFGPNGIKIYNLIKKYNLKINLIISFHGMDINVLPNQDKKYLHNILKINDDKNVLFTSPSEFLKSKMLKLGLHEKKIEVIYTTYSFM